MNKNLNITICGGGSLGHALIGYLSHKGHQINLFTNRPNQWKSEISISLPDKSSIIGELSSVSSQASKVIPKSDFVILCLPGYLIEETLIKIEPYLETDTIVGSVVSSNGFFWMADSILKRGNTYFGFERVPFIARFSKYGESGEIKGYKNKLKAYISDLSLHQYLSDFIEVSFDNKLEILNTIWPAALTNSNPLLHTARLYQLFKNYHTGDVFEESPLFYEDWNDESSELLINCDKEFQQIVSKLPVNKNDFSTILRHYDSTDVSSLTQKLRSIKAFKGIRLAMIETKYGYIPDWNSRYFSEDIPYGLVIIKGFAEYFNIESPTINLILSWAQEKMGKHYIENNKLQGDDLRQTGLPKDFTLLNKWLKTT